MDAHPLDRDVLTAVAALQPTAGLRAIQDHVASPGLPLPTQPEVLDALERLERLGLVEPKVEVEEGNRFAKRHIFYRAVDGAQVPWETPHVRRHAVGGNNG
jgi:hypothetical protein